MGDQFENLASARERLQLVVPACFLLILLLHYGALRSVRDAAILFTGVPMALVAASSIQDLMAKGMDRGAAARNGALLRLRPVVMTALVASLGFVPMAQH